jgi:signal transduction histidine kinase
MPGMMPGDKPDNAPPSFPTDKGMALAVAHHITVRYTKDKELKSIDNTLSDSYTDEDITAYCEKILTADKKEGTIDQLRYMMRENGDEITIVFIDHSSAVRTGKNLLIISIIACILAIFIFALISYFLSGWLVRPVEEAFNKQKQFISDASHELKTPITVILSNSELLEDSIGENKQLSYIKDECDRMHQLVTSLLTLTHLEQTPYEEITKNDFDMSNAVLERVLPMESVAFEKGIIMDYEDITPDITLNGVKEQIGQVVAILIDNAITHTDKGGKINVKLWKTPHHVHLTVANTGKEIPEEEREKLFERFYRADESRHRASGHFGLGLSIAKTIVTNHKGKIGVDCADGITTFTVSIKTAEK